MSKKVLITETILRDAHQSLIATRMTTEQMLPIVEKLDDVGYNALEAWGGATFDASLRFLNEDPWVRLRKIKDKAKKTPLQMLLRGQNILGYKHYADDVVDYFIQKAIANGMDIIRIFDALNDPRNIERSIKACVNLLISACKSTSYNDTCPPNILFSMTPPSNYWCWSRRCCMGVLSPDAAHICLT